MDFISIPMGWILKQFSNFFGGNFAFAVFFFTILINLLMLPLSIKTQKSTAKQARLKPKLDALKKKYGDDKVKYNQATQELYSKENVSMAGGCLPMVLRLVFMMGVYWAVMDPLTHIAGVPKDLIQQALEAVGARREIDLVALIQNGDPAVTSIISQNYLSNISFNLFGLNLTETPVFGWNIAEAFKPIWLIPILSFVTSMLNTLLSSWMQKKTNPDAPSMMGMMLVMPVFSLVIAFSFPGAVAFYWACSNVISGGIQIAVQAFYNPNRILAMDQAKFVIKRNSDEKEKIARIEGKSDKKQ